MRAQYTFRFIQRYWYRLYFSLVRPRDFVVTAIPRSGSSLLSTLLSETEDAFCFNEIHYNPATLPIFFRRMRKRLVSGAPVPVKLDDRGELTTDTMDGGVRVGERPFPRKYRHVAVGSNVNIPYLNRIDELLAYRYRIVALVRDPVYTLASWNSARVGKIPAAHVTDGDMHPRWNKLPFDSPAREDRQADIWEHYAARILSLEDRVLRVRYEALCEDPVATLAEVCDYLDVTAPKRVRPVASGNVDTRYPELGRIRDAVAARCPSKAGFGY